MSPERPRGLPWVAQRVGGAAAAPFPFPALGGPRKRAAQRARGRGLPPLPRKELRGRLRLLGEGGGGRKQRPGTGEAGKGPRSNSGHKGRGSAQRRPGGGWLSQRQGRPRPRTGTNWSPVWGWAWDRAGQRGSGTEGSWGLQPASAQHSEAQGAQEPPSATGHQPLGWSRGLHRLHPSGLGWSQGHKTVPGRTLSREDTVTGGPATKGLCAAHSGESWDPDTAAHPCNLRDLGG